MIGGVSLVFTQTAIACATLAAHRAVGIEFDARASRAVSIEELNL